MSMKTEQWICLVYPTYIVSPQSGLYKNNVNEYVKGIAKQDVGTLVWIIPSLTDFSISNCVLVICNSLIGRLFYFQYKCSTRNFPGVAVGGSVGEKAQGIVPTHRHHRI